MSGGWNFGARKIRVRHSRELFSHLLREFYDAERRFSLGLEEMLRHAADVRLQGALDAQLARTGRNLGLLERLFREVLGGEPEGSICEPARGILLGARSNVEGSRLGAVRDYLINRSLLEIQSFEELSFSALRLAARPAGYEVAELILGDVGATEEVRAARESLHHLSEKIRQTEHPGFIQRLTGQDYTVPEDDTDTLSR